MEIYHKIFSTFADSRMAVVSYKQKYVTAYSKLAQLGLVCFVALRPKSTAMFPVRLSHHIYMTIKLLTRPGMLNQNKPKLRLQLLKSGFNFSRSESSSFTSGIVADALLHISSSFGRDVSNLIAEKTW